MLCQGMGPKFLLPRSCKKLRLYVAFLHAVGLLIHGSYSSNEQVVKVGR